MKKVSYELMKLFCTEDKLRPILTEPFLIDGDLGETWVASDSYIILIVEKSNCLADISKKRKNMDGKAPNIYAIFDHKSKPTNIVTIEAIKQAIEEAPKVFEIRYESNGNELEECPACYGNGEIEDDVRFRDRYYSYSCECPICHGHGKIPVDPDYDPNDDDPETFESYKEVKTGKMIPDPKSIFNFNGRMYRYHVLDLLIKYMEHVGLSEAAYNFCKNNMIQFIMPHTYLCAMPMINDDLISIKVNTGVYEHQ